MSLRTWLLALALFLVVSISGTTYGVPAVANQDITQSVDSPWTFDTTTSGYETFWRNVDNIENAIQIVNPPKSPVEIGAWSFFDLVKAGVKHPSAMLASAETKKTLGEMAPLYAGLVVPGPQSQDIIKDYMIEHSNNPNEYEDYIKDVREIPVELVTDATLDHTVKDSINPHVLEGISAFLTPLINNNLDGDEETNTESPSEDDTDLPSWQESDPSDDDSNVGQDVNPIVIESSSSSIQLESTGTGISNDEVGQQVSETVGSIFEAGASGMIDHSDASVGETIQSLQDMIPTHN